MHVTDPMKLEPVWIGEVAYFWLHGLPGYDLRYSYTNRQLEDLRRSLERFDGSERVYVFFNSYAMYRDAQRFQSRVYGNPAEARRVWRWTGLTKAGEVER